MARQIIDSTQTTVIVVSGIDTSNSSSYMHTTSGGGGLKDINVNTTGYFTIQPNRSTSTHTYRYYTFNFDNIPNHDRIIINYINNSTQIRVSNTGTRYFSTKEVYLTKNLEKIGSAATISSTAAQNVITTASIEDINREDLNNIEICVHLLYGGSSGGSAFFYGSRINVNYSIFHYEYDIAILSNTSKVTSQTTEYTIDEGQTQVLTFNISNLNAVSIEDNYIDIKSQLVHTSGTTYTYTISNCDSDHIINCNDLAIEIDEDPQYTYHTVSISTINAVTNPLQGSYRYVEGQDIVIDIEPSEVEITLVRDNGIDISSQLVVTSNYITTFTTSDAYGNSWVNDDNNVWHNGNANNNSTRSIMQFNLDFNVSCLVTIYYWGTITGSDAFGIGNLNQTLSTGTGADNTAKVWTGSLSNITEENARSVTFDDVEGTNFIQVKVRRNNTTSGAANHTVYVKIEIQPLVPQTYRYTITNIQDNHSLLFVFGEVEYYIINASSQNENLKILPYGDWICLPGETYKVTIIPSLSTSTINITDNNIAQSNVERVEYLNENDETIVNYNYKIFNIYENHTVTIEEIINNLKKFIKLNNVWNEIVDIYQKTNNNWESKSIEDILSDINNLIIYKNI